LQRVVGFLNPVQIDQLAVGLIGQTSWAIENAHLPSPSTLSVSGAVLATNAGLWIADMGNS